MSVTLLALALLGAAGWFRLLARAGQACSRFRLVVEGVAVQMVIATLNAGAGRRPSPRGAGVARPEEHTFFRVDTPFNYS
jgi:hypothetical protein